MRELMDRPRGTSSPASVASTVAVVIAGLGPVTATRRALLFIVGLTPRLSRIGECPNGGKPKC